MGQNKKRVDRANWRRTNSFFSLSQNSNIIFCKGSTIYLLVWVWIWVWCACERYKFTYWSFLWFYHQIHWIENQTCGYTLRTRWQTCCNASCTHYTIVALATQSQILDCKAITDIYISHNLYLKKMSMAAHLWCTSSSCHGYGNHKVSPIFIQLTRLVSMLTTSQTKRSKLPQNQ